MRVVAAREPRKVEFFWHKDSPKACAVRLLAFLILFHIMISTLPATLLHFNKNTYFLATKSCTRLRGCSKPELHEMARKWHGGASLSTGFPGFNVSPGTAWAIGGAWQGPRWSDSGWESWTAPFCHDFRMRPQIRHLVLAAAKKNLWIMVTSPGHQQIFMALWSR